jgi:hypothetical protein
MQICATWTDTCLLDLREGASSAFLYLGHLWLSFVNCERVWDIHQLLGVELGLLVWSSMRFFWPYCLHFWDGIILELGCDITIITPVSSALNLSL